MWQFAEAALGLLEKCIREDADKNKEW